MKITWALVILLGSITLCHGQKEVRSLSLGNLYVPADGSVGIFNFHNFAEIGNGLLPGILATDRSLHNGIIVFAGNASWSNADDLSHVDGYVGSNVNSHFLLPTGDNGIYAPIGVSNGIGVEGAYYAANPAIAVTSKILSFEYTDLPIAGPFDTDMMNEKLENISDAEYWVLRGSGETKITLTWGAHSDLDDLVQSELTQLTIVGWDGTQWIDIPSSIDAKMVDIHSSGMSKSRVKSSLVQGSITTDETIVPDAFDVISIGKLKYDKSDKYNRVTVFPNPVFAGTYLNVRYNLAQDESGEMKILNSNNQVIFTKHLDSKEDKIQIPLSKHGRGIFTVAITSENGRTTYQKLIVVDQ